MLSRKVLAVIGAISAAAIVTGTAIALAANDPGPASPASTVSDDGTADQGRGDVATETPRPGDDDGTIDQGSGDASAGPSSEAVGDDDGMLDQGHGDVSGDDDAAMDDDDGTPDQGPGDVPAEAGEDGGHGDDSSVPNSDSGPGSDDGGHGSDDGGHGGSGSSGEGGAED